MALGRNPRILRLCQNGDVFGVSLRTPDRLEGFEELSMLGAASLG